MQFGSMDPHLPNGIANQLSDEIRGGRIPPGSVLRQDALAARFGVSRQPIRLALQLLRASGLLTLRLDRSLEVAGITQKQLRDLVATRILIEQEALRLAIRQRMKKNILEAEQMQQRLELETDPATLEELDKGFHAALYQPCKNLRLLALIGDLRSEHRRPYSDQPLGSVARTRWKKDHRRILKAYVAGDAAAALAALEDHLRGLVEKSHADRFREDT